MQCACKYQDSMLAGLCLSLFLKSNVAVVSGRSKNSGPDVSVVFVRVFSQLWREFYRIFIALIVHVRQLLAILRPFNFQMCLGISVSVSSNTVFDHNCFFMSFCGCLAILYIWLLGNTVAPWRKKLTQVLNRFLSFPFRFSGCLVFLGSGSCTSVPGVARSGAHKFGLYLNWIRLMHA